MAETHAFLPSDRYEHGTRARYVAAKCRCDRCREANRLYYHQRRQRSLEEAASIIPNGPPGEKVVRKRDRWGREREFRFKVCPGVDGRPCPRQADPRKGSPVCADCRERATVWNGCVPADAARKHILELRRKGIGYKAVAAAASTNTFTISEVLNGHAKYIRRATERRILAVDEGARADHSIIDAADLLRNLDWLKGEGFTATELAGLLKYKSPGAISVQTHNARKSGKCLAINAARVERLCNLVDAGEVHPKQKPLVPAFETRRKLFKLLKEGFNKKELARRAGCNPYSVLHSKNVRRTTAAKIAALHDEVMAGAQDCKAARAERSRNELRRLLDPFAKPPEDFVEVVEDPGRKRRMIAAYAEGVSMEDLEDRFGVDSAVIQKLAKIAGVKHGEAAI